MPSSRHAGQRVGARYVCIPGRAHYVARAFLLPPGSRRSRWRICPRASAPLVCSHRENVPLARTEARRGRGRGVATTEGMVERNGVAAREGSGPGEGEGEIYIPADTFAALKQPLSVRGWIPNPTPRERVCLHVPGGGRRRGWGSGRRAGSGVNAQFVFRSAEKTRSLHSRSSPTHSPKLTPRRRRPRRRRCRWISPSPALYSWRRRAWRDTNCRCINFPLESRRFLTPPFYIKLSLFLSLGVSSFIATPVLVTVGDSSLLPLRLLTCYITDIPTAVTAVIFIEVKEICIKSAKWFSFPSLQSCDNAETNIPFENQRQTQIVACLRRYRNSPFVI